MKKKFSDNKDSEVYRSLDVTDSYYVDVFRFLVRLAPIVGICAAVTFTVSKLCGLFPDTPFSLLIAFDMTAPVYLLLAVILNRYGIIRDGVVNMKVLRSAQWMLLSITVLQWNLISYIFPTREFWGYCFLFVLLSGFFFDKYIVLAGIFSICGSMFISWFVNTDRLLPELGPDFTENMILRVVSIVITFTMFYFLVVNAEKFKYTSKQHAEELSRKNELLSEMNRDIIVFTAGIVEERDETSGYHVRRVGHIVKMLAQQVKEDFPEYMLTDDDVELISLASTLHDIGKIAIPDSILKKPGKLTSEEYEIIKTHTTSGVKMIDRLPASVPDELKKCAREICLYHHERYDGSGYPMRLVGDGIPLAAQISAIADCFEAMTAERPYKDPFPPDIAAQKILDGDCGAFNDKLLSCFEKCIKKPDFLIF